MWPDGPVVSHQRRIADGFHPNGCLHPTQPIEGIKRRIGTYIANDTTIVAYRDRPQPDTVAFPAITHRWT